MVVLGDLKLTGLSRLKSSDIKNRLESGSLGPCIWYIVNASVTTAGSHQSAFHLILHYPYTASTYLPAGHVLNIIELSGCAYVIVIVLLLHSFPSASHAHRCHAEVLSCIQSTTVLPHRVQPGSGRNNRYRYLLHHA